MIQSFRYWSSSFFCCLRLNEKERERTQRPQKFCICTNSLLHRQPSLCPRSRPHYKCEPPPVFYHFESGALSASCDRTPFFEANAFPRDHLRDMFASFATSTPPPPSSTIASLLPDNHDPAVVLVVTRERGEHANLFHTQTDWLNCFFTLHNAGIIDGLAPPQSKNPRYGMSDVQVLLLDEQEGPFDALVYSAVFGSSAQRPPLKISQLDKHKVYRLPRALFVPPGYTNIFQADIFTDSSCPHRTLLMKNYRRFVLHGVGLGDRADAAPVFWAYNYPLNWNDIKIRRGVDVAPIRVTLISRRPYNKFVEHSFMGRQIANEEELIAAMQHGGNQATGHTNDEVSRPAVHVTRVDLAQLDAMEQMRVVADTEVFVGMHGAALMLSMYLPPHAAVVEIWPRTHQIWRVFEHLTRMSSGYYYRWANSDASKYKSDAKGEYLTVDTAQFLPTFKEAVAGVMERRMLRVI